MKPSRGIAIALAVIVLAVIFVIILTLINLMRGVSSQVAHSDSHIRALTIAESGVNLLISRMMSKPWDERWFAGEGEGRADLPLERGSLDYFISDTSDRDMTADVWVRGTFGGTRRLLFYRVAYEERIFRGLTQPSTDFTRTLEDDGSNRLNDAQLTPLAQEMNELIQQRERSRAALTEVRADLTSQIDPLAIIKRLGGQTDSEIPETVKPLADGQSSHVMPLLAAPAPSGSRPVLKNTENPEQLEKWILELPLVGPDMILHLRGLLKKLLDEIDYWYELEKYINGEEAYKRFHAYVLAIPGIVEAHYGKERLRHQTNMAAIACTCTPESDCGCTARTAAEIERHNDQMLAIRQGETLPEANFGGQP